MPLAKHAEGLMHNRSYHHEKEVAVAAHYLLFLIAQVERAALWGTKR
ncbi:MAG TPA: hypothetical protein VFO27_04940 [Bryobacteraceae bacterium]|nr:hypothetical protein [Bryobacteraceae bacterium]